MLVGKASPDDMNLHPLNYKWAYDLYNQAVRNTWFPHEIALKEDLEDWESNSSNFKLFTRMTDKDGYIDFSYVQKCVGDLSNPIFYVVGPSGFVAAMNKILEELKVSRDDIRFEEFTGY